MVDAIEATADWLTREASQTLDLVHAKDYHSADLRVQSAWAQWQPAAETLRESMKRLYDLRAVFIAESGAT